jgi:hypothetical protein
MFLVQLSAGNKRMCDARATEPSFSVVALKVEPELEVGCVGSISHEPLSPEQ